MGVATRLFLGRPKVIHMITNDRTKKYAMLMTLILFGTALAGCLGTEDADETETETAAGRDATVPTK